MSRNLDIRDCQARTVARATAAPRCPRDFPMTAEDRAAVANARGRVAVLPYKCRSVEEWVARYAQGGMRETNDERH
jgi:hypothetical protein